MDLLLNNPQVLIYHTTPNKQPTNQPTITVGQRI